MGEKTYQVWKDLQADATIGGTKRIRCQKVPDIYLGLEGLVNPGDQWQLERLRAETKGREIVAEIGPGKGLFLCAIAARNPGRLVVGFEVRLGYCVRCLKRAQRAGLKNVRAVWGDVRATMPLVLEPGSIVEAYMLYPDPWWKYKHAERRYGDYFANMMATYLKAGAIFVLKSDVLGYLEDLQALFLRTGRFEMAEPPADLPLSNRDTKIALLGGKSFTTALIRR